MAIHLIGVVIILFIIFFVFFFEIRTNLFVMVTFFLNLKIRTTNGVVIGVCVYCAEKLTMYSITGR